MQTATLRVSADTSMVAVVGVADLEMPWSESEPREEQLDVQVEGAIVITVLGDSLSSTEARCNAVVPWPMLLQKSLDILQSLGSPRSDTSKKRRV